MLFPFNTYWEVLYCKMGAMRQQEWIQVARNGNWCRCCRKAEKYVRMRLLFKGSQHSSGGLDCSWSQIWLAKILVNPPPPRGLAIEKF